MFRALARKIRYEDLGQDLAEYCLLTALVAVVAFGIFYYVSGGVHDLWTTANTTLVDGNTSGGGESADHAPAGNH
jgi:Flp pilus assembly pilin Flp